MAADGKGERKNDGKLRFDLVHPLAHQDMVKVLTNGAIKYKSRNWERGMSWTSVIASMKRHISAIERGEDYDSESGLPHAAHVQCNAHFLNAYYYIYPQGDDRPKRFTENLKIGLDIDELLADWVSAWMEEFHIPAKPEFWNFDRNISDRFNKLKSDGKLDSMYSNLKPLIKPSELPFEPHCYITSRPVSTELTESWLDKNGFPTKKVYTVGLGQSKAEVAKDAGIDIFIDDSYSNFVELNSAGILTYLFTRPHNTRYDVGHLRIDSLKDLPVLKI